MPFGGGGGFGPISAHVHTNDAGQGGALDDTTLLNTPSLVSQLRTELIATHEASGAESSHQFTDTINFDIFSEVWVIFRGAQTAAFILELQINNVGSSANQSYGSRLDLAPLLNTTINPSLNANFLSMNDATGGGANFDLYGKLILKVGDESLTNRAVHGVSNFSIAGGHSWKLHHQIGTNIDEITELDFRTSTSTWTAGTRISVYGVRFD